jgi:hypothetical protein
MTNANTILKRIISVIREKGNVTVKDIKRSIAVFNQSGGTEALRKYLAELVSDDTLTVHTEKSGNGHPVDYYRLVNGNENNSDNGNADNRNNSSNPRITVTIDIVLHGWQDVFCLFSSLINTDSSNANGNDCNTDVSDVDIEECNVPCLYETYCDLPDVSDENLKGETIDCSKPQESDNGNDYENPFFDNDDPPFFQWRQ